MAWRIMLALAGTALWGAVLVLGWEASNRLRHAYDIGRVSAFKLAQSEAIRQRDAAHIAAQYGPAPPKPDWAPTRFPDRRTFFTRDHAGRDQFAQDRGEAVLVCTQRGEIVAMHLPDSPWEIRALLAPCGAGSALDCFLPSTEAEDARAAVARGHAGEWTGVRFHALRVPDRRDPMLIELLVLPRDETPSAEDKVLLAVRATKYAKIAHSYRPHYYAHSDHDPLYPQFLQSEFWTNSLGFRDVEITMPRPADRFRIVCVGGSTTVEGPRNDLTYPKLLEQRLADRFAPRDVEVLNCGVDGMGSDAELERLAEFIALDPSLLIYYSFVNDQPLILHQSRQQAGEEGTVASPIYAWSRVAAESKRRAAIPTKEALLPLIEERTFANLRRAAIELRPRNIRMAVASVARPDFERLSRVERNAFDPRYGPVLWSAGDREVMVRMVDAYNERLPDFCKEEGILYVPVAEHLRGGVELFADMVHLNMLGIERKAEIMSEALAPGIAALLEVGVEVESTR